MTSYESDYRKGGHGGYRRKRGFPVLGVIGLIATAYAIHLNNFELAMVGFFLMLISVK